MIGSDPETWSRSAPLPPAPPWIDEEFDRLVEAIRGTSAGESEAAVELLSAGRDRDEELREWYRTAIWVGTARARILDIPSGYERLPRADHDKRPRASHHASLFERDGHRCRYCQRRVIPEKVLIAASDVLGPEVFRVKGDDRTRRGAAMVFRAVDDHVLPLSCGGKTVDANLVTSCYPCNFSKYNFTVEQLGLDDPRDRPPIIDDWDGLTSLLSRL